MTEPVDETKENVVLRARSGDEEGKKRVEKVETASHNLDTLKHMEKKLVDKGVQRQDRHPIDGLPLARGPPKSGHGGKYTWEGPRDFVDNELHPFPAAVDEKDPNYVDEEAEERILRGDVSDVAGYVIGEVEVPKVAEAGVARVDVNRRLLHPN